MVTPQHSILLALGIGGLLSANSAFAQVNCTIQFDAGAQIDLPTLAQTLTDCANEAASDVWFELVDRGSYDLVYSAPEGDADRRITGIAHTDWDQRIALAVGTLFGFRAVGLATDDLTDETIDIVTYLPDGPDGPRPPDVSTKPITVGAVEAALFLIGSEQFLIPGEWRIELRYRDQILAAQRFLLEVPEPQ